MKLVVLSGPIRGKVLDLASGNNFIGRAEENSITLPSGQVSRRHACISLTGDRVFLEDLGSSNGTFVGEQRIQQKVALKPGSRFRIGEFMMELSVDGRVSGAPAAVAGKPAPAPRPGRGQPAAGQVMPIVMPRVQAGETPFWRFYRTIAFLGWRGQVVLGAMGLVLIVIGLGVYPLLKDEQRTLTQEVLKRGKVLVNRLAMRNGEFVKNMLETNLDATQILSEEGVVEAYLLTPNLMVLSPVEQRGRSMSNRTVCANAFRSGNVVVASEAELEIGEGRAGVYHMATPIRVWANEQGRYKTYGVAYIVMDARRVAEVNARTDVKLTAAGIVVAVAMALYLVALFLLTNRPLGALADDGELVLRGDLRAVESRARWKELNSLAHTLNRSFDRYHQAASATSAATLEAVGPSFVAGDRDASIEDAKVSAIADAVSEAVLVTDEMQRVVYLNQRAARTLGATLQTARGRHIMEAIANREVLGEVLDILKKLVESDSSTVSTKVTLPGESGPGEHELVASGVRDDKTGQLSYAAIVIR